MADGVTDDDEDSICTSSTSSSEQQSEYEVEEVFAEKRYPDGMRYLVKWANYPMHRCSWEPEECFNTPGTLLEWSQKKKAIREGKAAPFDHVEWQNQQEAREEARLERQRRRAEKRMRIHARAQKKIGRIATPSQTPSSRIMATPGSLEGPGHATSLARPEKRTSPSKAPPILFGNGQKNVGLLRLKEPSNDNRPVKHFNLSTKRRYEKAKTDEPAPDISQLELFRPSEWPSRTPVNAATSRPTQGPSKDDKLGDATKNNDGSVSTSHAQDYPSSGNPAKGGLDGGLSRAEKSDDPSNRVDSSVSTGLVQDSPSSFNAARGVTTEGLLRNQGPGESSNRMDSSVSNAHAQNLKPSVNAAKAGPIEGQPRTENSGELSNQTDSSVSAVPVQSFAYGAKVVPMEGQAKVSGDSSERTDSDVSTTQVQNALTSMGSSASNHNSSDPYMVNPLQHQTSKNSSYSVDRRVSMPEGAPVLPRRVPGPGSLKFSNGRFFNPGEVLAYLYYGPEKTPIGAARLCGLTAQAKFRILISKSKSDRSIPERSVEIWFQHLCTLQDYERLCFNTANKNWCTGWIEGFNDTEVNLFRMAQDLRQRDLMAVAIPSHASQNVLLAYPPNSRDFGFLQSNFKGRGEFSLCFTARSHLGSIERLDGRKVHQAFAPIDSRPSIPGFVNEHSYPPNTQREGPNNRNAVVPEAPALSLPQRRKTNDPAAMHVEQHETQGPTNGKPARLSSSDQPPLQESESIHLDPSTLPSTHPPRPVVGFGNEQRASTDQEPAGFDLDVWFERQFGVTFSRLLDSKQMAGFYVMYPSQTDAQADAQCDLLMAFLQKHTTQTYSSRQSKDWDTFTLMEPGVALFHENFVDFHTLPSMAKLLPKNITFWSFSLQVPHEDAGHAAYFHRIFPHGIVFLLTEDVMLQKPEKTATFLAWFRDNLNKRSHGTSRLMVRPRILEWVLYQFDKSTSFKGGIWIVIHQLIMELGISSNADASPESDALDHAVLSLDVPSYMSSADGQKPDNASDSPQEQRRRADRLAEFFAGWALVNRYQFRQFHIISGIEPLDRWRTWQHVVVDKQYQHTASSFKIDFMYYWSKIFQSHKGGSTTEEKYQNTPHAFTPLTPRASSSRSEQPLATTSSTVKYPQPYL